MQIENTIASPAYAADAGDAHASGISWGAVLAGAAAAAAVTVILLMLGLGLGLSSVSPWSFHASAIHNGTIAWLIAAQIIAAGLGGYLAGRLRVKWARVHNDEVHFRDTAHGLLAWAVATLVMVGLLAGGTRAILGEAANSAGASQPATTGSYYSDMILRTPEVSQETDNSALRAEVNRIFMVDIASGNMPKEDQTYLGVIMAKRTGMAQADAERHVNDIYNDALAKTRNAADEARKAAAHSALWMFVALLCGAFVASVMATLGGRQRDNKLTVLPG
jgi:hypothetical protein